MDILKTAIADTEVEHYGIGLEGITAGLLDSEYIYIVLTDTKTQFSKISKAITGQPYNHVSLAFDGSLDTLYTYALKTQENGTAGGFKVETRKMLKGAEYETYRISIAKAVLRKLEKQIKQLIKSANTTRYNRLGLINAIFGKEIIGSRDVNQLICSEFVVLLLRDVGIDLFKNRAASTLKPYDLVQSNLLSFVERGTL